MLLFLLLVLLMRSIAIVTQPSNMCYTCITCHRNNPPTTDSPHVILPSSSITMAEHVSTDAIITTSSSSSSSYSFITDTLLTSTTDNTAVTATVSNVTNTTHSDNVTHSTSSVHTATGDHTVATDPTVLDNNSGTTDGSHDADNAHNGSVNATEGSGDPVMPMPTNTSDDAMVTSHGTEEEYDNGEEETFTDSLPTHQPPLTIAGQQQQKSSVLIRLSNRIKELEVNMSLFGDYLERVRTRCVIT